MHIKLGINIDHAATLRNARGENDPSILEFALEVQKHGADSITMHLREDRRHIRDNDVFLVRDQLKIPLNFEMAANREMLEIALELNPKSVCLVPEKREEITTEGGLDIKNNKNSIQSITSSLIASQIEVFFFIEPEQEVIQLARDCGATGVEVHTGKYARSFLNQKEKELQRERIFKAADFCQKINMEFHAGHGLNYHNIPELATIKNLVEVNIGHAIISRALFTGIGKAVLDMKKLLSGNET